MVSQHRLRRQRQSTVQKRRLERSRHARLARTIALGTVAVVFALFWVARELELDRDQLLDYLGTSALFVAILIGSGVVGAVVLWLIKRLR